MRFGRIDGWVVMKPSISSVFRDGINWHNVATVFYFGYCIARDRLTRGIQHFLSQLLKWILNVFKRLGIFQWILRQGGWVSGIFGIGSGSVMVSRFHCGMRQLINTELSTTYRFIDRRASIGCYLSLIPDTI